MSGITGRILSVSRRVFLTGGVGVVAAMLWLGGAQPASAQAPSVEIHLVKAGFIVGVSGGSGTLYVDGRAYPLVIGGVSLGATIGASSADLRGVVLNLRRPSDIEGTYSAVQAGLALAGGDKVAELQNSKGVVLRVSGKQIGLEFALDLSGMQVSLK